MCWKLLNSCIGNHVLLLIFYCSLLVHRFMHIYQFFLLYAGAMCENNILAEVNLSETTKRLKNSLNVRIIHMCRRCKSSRIRIRKKPFKHWVPMWWCLQNNPETGFRRWKITNSCNFFTFKRSCIPLQRVMFKWRYIFPLYVWGDSW
jgi:hypothetical protein